MKLKVHWQILLALVSATLLALVFRSLAKNASADGGMMNFIDAAVTLSGYFGGIFMLLLKMIIVPLVASSVVAGISSLHGVAGFGRLLRKTAAFYALSSFLAICLGLLLVNLIQPGLVDGKPNTEIMAAFESQAQTSGEAEQGKIESAVASSKEQGGFAKQMGGFFERMIPPNVFTAATDNGQLLGLIFFSLLFSVAMTQLPEAQVVGLRGFFQGVNDTMIVMTGWIMALAPIGVFGLILPVIYDAGGGIFLSLGKYFTTVLLALGLHLFVVMPMAVKLLTGKSGWAHLRNMRTALLTAFSTASSSATLAVTMQCVQENAGVSKRVSSFTLPLGATVNMDGTALYECVAVMFVAQVMGIEMSFTAQFMVVLSALLTSVGVAGIPSASLVAIFIILKNSHIPNAEIAVVALLSVDRLLDMSRTAVNVFGDSCAALFVDHGEQKREGVEISAEV